MDFRSVTGSNHLIEPIGYGIVRKIVKRGAPVRSAKEQFAIHCIAHEFIHPHICVVKPIGLESSRAYTMDQIYEAGIIPPEDYYKHAGLYVGLMEFQQFMAVRGYWPWGYKVFWNGQKCFLIDFSKFGSIDRNHIQFPKIKQRCTVDNVEDYFPLRLPTPQPSPLLVAAPRELEPVIPTLNLQLDMEKIEDWEIADVADEYLHDLLSS